MNTKTTLTMVITLIAMIGLTGIGTAMDTNVQYNGDGSYTCTYDAYGTGSIGIHTYTSDGSDHLVSGWTNTEAHGWQMMDTYSGTASFGGDYSGTMIDRSVTVGGIGIGQDEAGYIITLTTDNDNNSVFTYANYHDNYGYGSHVTTDQTVVVGSLVNIGGVGYNVTGVIAKTEISGFAYGSDTTVSGLVMTRSGDDYTYVLLAMDNGWMNLYTFSAAGSVDSAVTIPWGFGQLGSITIDGACGQSVEVGAQGVGTFVVKVGTDMHGAEFKMEDDLGTIYYDSFGTNVNMTMITTFDGTFDASGYVYAVDLT